MRHAFNANTQYVRNGVCAIGHINEIFALDYFFRSVKRCVRFCSALLAFKRLRAQTRVKLNEIKYLSNEVALILKAQFYNTFVNYI